MFLVSCRTEMTFNSDTLNDFIGELEDKYDYLEKSKVKKTEAGIHITIYFKSKEGIEFDETIHEDIKAFFMNEDYQKLIFEDYSEDYSNDDIPIIYLAFIDSEGRYSHDFSSLHGYTAKDSDNIYGTWSAPQYD